MGEAARAAAGIGGWGIGGWGKRSTSERDEIHLCGMHSGGRERDKMDGCEVYLIFQYTTTSTGVRHTFLYGGFVVRLYLDGTACGLWRQIHSVARQRVERFRCVRTGRGTGTGTQLASVSSRAAHRRASMLRYVCGDELAQDGAEDMRIVARICLGGGRFARWALLVEVDEEHLEAGGRRRMASARRRRAAGVRPCGAPPRARKCLGSV